MDIMQALIIAVIIALTGMLAVIGIQVFYILRELRKTVEKTNRVLTTTEEITQSVSAPVSALSSTLVGLKGGTILAAFLKKLRERKERNNDERS